MVAARLAQCFDSSNRDFRIDVANRPADSLYCRGGISCGANEDSAHMLRMLRGRGVYFVRRIAVKAELLNVTDHSDYSRASLFAGMRNGFADRILLSPMSPCERQTNDSHQGTAFIVGVLKAPSLQNRDAKGLEVTRRHDPHRRGCAWESPADIKLLDPGSVGDGVRIQGETGRYGDAQQLGLGT